MKLTFFLSFVLLFSISYGQQISTEAPSVSASGVTVSQNDLQIETSFDVAINNDYAPIINTQYRLPFVLVRYGILDKLEVRATGSFLHTSTNTNAKRYYAADLGLGLKYELLNTDKNTSLALIGHYHTDKFIDRRHHATGTLAFGQGWGKRHSIGANLGFQYTKTTGNFHFDTYTGMASLIYNISFFEKLTAFAEVYGSMTDYSPYPGGFKPPSEQAIGLDFGLMWLVTDLIQIDYVSGFSLTNNQHFHSLGFNILLPLSKKENGN